MRDASPSKALFTIFAKAFSGAASPSKTRFTIFATAFSDLSTRDARPSKVFFTISEKDFSGVPRLVIIFAKAFNGSLRLFIIFAKAFSGASKLFIMFPNELRTGAKDLIRSERPVKTVPIASGPVNPATRARPAMPAAIRPNGTKRLFNAALSANNPKITAPDPTPI